MDTRWISRVTEDLQTTCFICGDTLEQILKGNGDQSLKSFAIEHVLELKGNILEGIWSEEKGDFGGDEEESSGRRLDLCAECADRVEEAKVLYLTLVEVVKRFRGIQREIVEDVRRRLGMEEVMDGKRSKWHQAIDECEYEFSEDFVVRPPEKWTLKKGSPSSVERVNVNESEPTKEEEDDDEVPMSPLAEAEDAQDPLGIQIEAKTEEDEEGDAGEGILMDVEEGTPEPVKSEAEDEEEEQEGDSWEPSADELLSEEENFDSMSSPSSHSESDDDDDQDETEEPPTKKWKGKRPKGKKCPVCGVHKATWYLPTHMLKMHGIQKDGKRIAITQTCDICGESLPTSKMEAHLLEHVGEEYLRKCLNSWCTLVFPHQFALRKHLHTHKSCYYIVRPSKDSLSSSDKFLIKSRGKLRCSQCGVRLRSLEFLRCHLNNKHENCEPSKQTLSCPMNQCLSIFRYKQSVEVHLALDHCHNSDLKATIVPHAHPCVDCGPNQKVPFDQMETHLKTVHKVKEIIKCSHCRYLFSSREHLINHTYDHHRKSISTYSCDICPAGKQQFSTPNKWIQHYFEAHGIGRQYKCDQCPASFLQKNLLTKHKTGKHVSGNCDVCGKSFLVAQLQYHKKVAHQEKSDDKKEGGSSKNADWVAGEYKCDVCDKPFQYQYVLQVHQRMEHEMEKGQEGKPKEKEHASDSSLKESKNVTSDQLVKCDICDIRFTPTLLKRHKWQVHSDHHCSVCQKEFKLEHELDEHKKTHSGPVTCPEPGCGKVSANIRALHTHQKRIHEQPQKFICEDCGKEYTDNRYLKEHRILVHLGGHESSFPCQDCGKEFKSKQRLNSHRYDVHLKGSEAFVCEECGQSFKHKSSLRTHATKKHGNKKK